MTLDVGVRSGRGMGMGFLVMSLLVVGQAQAQVVPDTTATHLVRSGDTLWDLARMYLNDPFRWPEIHALNRDVVGDPHWIYPAERLLIPGRTGTVIPPMGVVPSALGRTVFYGQGIGTVDPRTVRMTPPDEIAVVESGAYYRASLLLPEGEIGPIGELVEVVSPTVIGRRGTPQIQPYDHVLMRISGVVQVGDRLHLMRAGRVVQPYGRMYMPTGSALVLAVQGGTATIEIDRMYDRVEVGDLALPFPSFEPRSGASPQPAGGLEGRLLTFVEQQPIAATGDVGFLDLGSASGVVEGDEFVALIPATTVSWGVRPEVEVARLQVVRAGRVTSAVRVISLEQPALEEGMRVRLVGKMPAPSD